MRLRVLGLGALPLLAPVAAVHAHGTFYINDQAAFEALVPGVLTYEDLSEAPDAVTGVPETFIEQATINAAFPGDAVKPGLQIEARDGNGMVIVGPSFSDSTMGPTGYTFARPEDPNGFLIVRFLGYSVTGISFQVLTEGVTSARITAYTIGGLEFATADITDDAHVGLLTHEERLGWIEINSPAGLTGAHEAIGELSLWTEGLTAAVDRRSELKGQRCSGGGWVLGIGRDVDANEELSDKEQQLEEVVCFQDVEIRGEGFRSCAVTTQPARRAKEMVLISIAACLAVAWRRRQAAKCLH